MKTLMSITLITLAVVSTAWAADSKFIKLYDAGKYDEAAKMLESVNLKNPEVLCRAGAMYYSGLGVEIDLERGKSYLEYAMSFRNVSSAVNLTKIYFHKEKNIPKAAYCLLVAETLGDHSVKEEVAKLKTRMGDEYKRGLELYIQQMQKVLKGTLDSMKAKAAEYSEDSATLRRKITDMGEEKKGLEEQINKFKDNLIEKEKEKKELEEKLKSATNSNSDLQNKMKVQSIDNEKRLKSELERASKKYKELKAAHDKFIKDKYNVLVTRFNENVDRFGKLQEDYKELKVRFDMLKDKYEGDEPEGSLFILGMGRGLATLCMSPLNYVRGLSYIQNVSSVWEKNGAESGVAKIFAIPMIVFETVPFVADIGNGSLDLMSFGYYGDWLYGDDKYTPWWFNRDDKVFPWLQKEVDK